MLGNAFLKFVWANRMFSYCSVVMGAVPDDPENPRTMPLAMKAGKLNSRAAMNFNAGLCLMYFALYALVCKEGATYIVANGKGRKLAGTGAARLDYLERECRCTVINCATVIADPIDSRPGRHFWSCPMARQSHTATH